MNKNILRLNKKIVAKKFFKENKLKLFSFLNSNLYFDNISSQKFPSRNSLIFIEKKNFDIKNKKENIFKSCLIVTNDLLLKKKYKKNIIFSKTPRQLFLRILKILKKKNFFKYKNNFNEKYKKSGVFILENVSIGKNCKIGKNVYLSNCEIGNNVSIGPNTTIGYEGVTIYKKNKKNYKFPNFGKVIIEDNVSIGSNCSVMRGTLNNTILFKNVIMSNLINIGHSVHIGNSSVISSGVQIIGGAQIGSNCLVGSRSAINANIKIGNNSYIGLGSVVTKNVDKNCKVFGNPAKKISKL
tara:strand:- start:11448 stop:12338 length:891 start_codon:yes stop_codon:yes gene_type:complete